MGISVGIIADDLTGACDTGGQFAEHGMNVVVCIDAGGVLPYRCDHPDVDISASVPKVNVLVVNTQSRSLQPGVAYLSAREAAERLSELDPSLLMKKIDTAFRGNPGIEIEGVMDGSGADLAVVVSSIPGLGRTTVGGYQLINGQPLKETAYVSDPVCPVIDSDVVTVLRRQCRKGVTGLGLDAVRSGNLLRSVEKVWKDGIRIIAFDSETDDDVETIVKETMRSGRNVLYVGSLGLAHGLAQQLAHGLPYGAIAPVPFVPVCKRVVLGFSGTTYQKTRIQLRRASETECTEVIELDPVHVMEGRFEEGGTPAEELVRTVEDKLNRGRNIFITIAECSVPVAGDVGAGFSRVARLICERTRFDTLVLIGGETSYRICKLLGVGKIAVDKCLSTVMAAGRLEGGIVSGMRVMIKGGSVGDEGIIARAIAERATGCRL